MAFPTSPVDGQLYTNALGTQYKFYLADTAWKIVNGGGGGTIGGTGTAGYLTKFVDSTTIGNSTLRNVSGNTLGTDNLTMDGTISSLSGTSTFNQLQVQNTSTTLSTATIYNSDNTGIAQVRLYAPGPQGDNNLYIESYGKGRVSATGPDGTAITGGISISSEGEYLEINQQLPNRAINLTYRHASKIIVDSEGAKINDISPITGPTVNFNDCGQIITQTGVWDPTSSIVRIVDERTSGQAWNAFDLRDDQIAHGCTDIMPSTKSYGAINQGGAGYPGTGGLSILGASDSSLACGISLFGVSANPSSYSYPVIGINAAIISGTVTDSVPDASYAVVIKNNSVPEVFVMGNGAVGIGAIPSVHTFLHVNNLPQYANNAAAAGAGLTVGDFYRDGGDPDHVCVVHT